MGHSHLRSLVRSHRSLTRSGAHGKEVNVNELIASISCCLGPQCAALRPLLVRAEKDKALRFWYHSTILPLVRPSQDILFGLPFKPDLQATSRTEFGLQMRSRVCTCTQTCTVECISTYSFALVLLKCSSDCFTFMLNTSTGLHKFLAYHMHGSRDCSKW